MSDVTVCLIGRLICAAIATGGAIYLASKQMPGWGWMVFLALYLGSIVVKESE